MMDTTTLDRMRDEHCFLLDKSLPRVVRQLREMPAVEKVILFGSYAAGRRDLFTDLDLIVVMQSDQHLLTVVHCYTYISNRRLAWISWYTPQKSLSV